MTSQQAMALSFGGSFALLGSISVVPYIILTNPKAARLKWLVTTALVGGGFLLLNTALGFASGLSFPGAMLYTGTGGRAGGALACAVTALGVALMWGIIEGTMGLSSLFARTSRGTASATQVSLTVLYVTGRDSLSAENVIALRDIISRATPIDFVFLNPGSFEVFFPGTQDGEATAERLTAALKSFAAHHSISPFGVGVQVGPCLVAQDTRGRFTSPPAGETISRAMRAATQEASSAL